VENVKSKLDVRRVPKKEIGMSGRLNAGTQRQADEEMSGEGKRMATGIEQVRLSVDID
jgi:hypothetical protein